MLRDKKIGINMHTAHIKSDFNKAKHKITSANRRPC